MIPQNLKNYEFGKTFEKKMQHKQQIDLQKKIKLLWVGGFDDI